MTGRSSHTLSFDGWGRLAGGSFGGQRVSYSFDAAGLRRPRTSGPVTSRYLLGGLFETDAAGQITLADVDGPQSDLAHYAGPPSPSSPVSFLYSSPSTNSSGLSPSGGNPLARPHGLRGVQDGDRAFPTRSSGAVRAARSARHGR